MRNFHKGKSHQSAYTSPSTHETSQTFARLVASGDGDLELEGRRLVGLRGVSELQTGSVDRAGGREGGVANTCTCTLHIQACHMYMYIAYTMYKHVTCTCIAHTGTR